MWKTYAIFLNCFQTAIAILVPLHKYSLNCTHALFTVDSTYVFRKEINQTVF